MWMLTLLTGGSTVAIKGLGGLVGLRSSRLNEALTRATPLLLPGVLTALIVVQVFSRGRELTIDARVAGLLMAIAGVHLRWQPALTLVAAAVATAIVRHFGIR